ncbi:MAG: hypothetical protein IJ155_09675 [Prevotella sp.]|nr:hypothetical protein [Prevotella sp.]
MTDNIDISKVRPLVNTDQSVNVESIHSLKKVSEEIQQAIDVVDAYKRKLDSLQPPVVNGEPWYKFSFGKASVKEVNIVMKSFSDFVQKTFKLVATIQEFQNENDMNICRLVGLLAIAEANSYEKLDGIASQMKELSTEDEESARQLKELEKSFLQSLDDSAIDSIKKEEQMSRLMDYIALFTESRTRKIRSISLSLSEIKTKLDEYCTTQDYWIEDTKKEITHWQEELNNSLAEIKKQSHEEIKYLEQEQKQKFTTLQIALDENLKKIRDTSSAIVAQQEQFIEQIKKQTEQALDNLEKRQREISERLQQEQHIINILNKQMTYYKMIAVTAGAISLASSLYIFLT